MARYTEIADAGFTFVVSGNYADDGNIIGQMLSVADQTGLKVLVSDDTQVRNMTRWFTISDDRSVPMSITTADARELFQRALDAYGPHKSLAGFNLFDEPWDGIFGSLGKAFDVARTLAPQLLPYANLLPGNGPSYDTYVNNYIAATKPALLSFDRYIRSWPAARTPDISTTGPVSGSPGWPTTCRPGPTFRHWLTTATAPRPRRICCGRST
ncbi:hypothetical protein [Fodinicola feengrottensis]|uniref:hypothetical protein n=1 Tax=Fodinicola feengrottensis TaxID=435914 RepID=UPI0013CF7D7A|nr:hypothetical protein [Fodinicola feengrottensis]